MRRVVPLLTLGALLGAGCSSRPHANPFDPLNPDTRGRPAGFVAIAEQGLVILSWQRAVIGGEVGYQLYRRAEGEIGFTPMGAVLPVSQTRILDTAVSDGVRFDYRLYFVLSGSLSGLPAEDYAVPGTRRVWLADLGSGSLQRLSADGHRLAGTSTGFLGPTQVTFDARNRRVWVSDTYDGRVVSVERDGTSRISIGGLTEPVALVADSVRDRLWICDQARDAVYPYRLNGQPASPALTLIDSPIGIAFDPEDGSLWVCERGGNRVRRFTAAGTPSGSTNLAAPSRVAVDSLTHDAWVTSFESGAAYRIAPDGTPGDTVALAGPIGIAVDARRGRVWVADAVAGSLVALRRSGQVEFRVNGLPAVREVAVEPSSGECFATVPGANRAVRVSPAGVVLASTGGLDEPYGIVIEP